MLGSFLNMAKELGGNFSSGFMSLQLQLKTLFDDAGGTESLRFLDALSRLTPTEQALALKLFKKVIERIASGEIRITTKKDEFLKDLEETLYNDIVSSMKEASGGDCVPVHSARKLEVLNGGKKAVAKEKTIDFRKAKQERKERQKPLIN